MLNQYLISNGDATVKLYADQVIAVGDATFITTEQTLGTGNLDSGSAFSQGTDYYVYLCNSSGMQIVKISANSTYPSGFTAATSRKIGGFHYGRCRRVNSSTEPINTSSVVGGSGWETNTFLGILPRSVWTMLHRPKCSPEGMVYLTDGVWVDIYLASVSSGLLASKYNATPATGTEGYSWYTFAENAMKVGKRMLDYQEWCQAAYGSPPGGDSGNTYCWCNESARHAAGTHQYAISAIGCADCAGNVWEWNKELIVRFDGTQSWAWQDVLGTSLGDATGKAYMLTSTALVALVCGGIWDHGAFCGARALSASLCPWYVYGPIGSRLACDSL